MTIFQKIIAYGHAKQYNNNTHFTVTVPRSLIEYCNVPHQIKKIKKSTVQKGGIVLLIGAYYTLYYFLFCSHRIITSVTVKIILKLNNLLL